MDRRSCTRFSDFVQKAWHVLEPSTELKWGWALDAMCDHLEAVTKGQIFKLLMNVPPGTMKSLLVNVFWPAWEWGPMDIPHHRFLSTAHKEPLAIRDNVKCRRLIQSEWFQERWPVVLLGDQNAKGKFENNKTGFREAMAFSSMTGSRGDRVMLDDPLSVDDAKSDAALLNAEFTFKEALPTRLNDQEKSAVVVIMQRLHEKDTSGIILDLGLNYDHLCLPMRFEEERRCSTSIGFVDPRMYDGELVFPERYPEAAVKDLENTMGAYATAGQFQQRPAPRGGGMFQAHWFHFVGAAPNNCTWIRAWDFAATDEKENKNAAFSAGLKMGMDTDGNFFISNVNRGQWSSGVLEKNLKQTAERDGKSVYISMPQDPGASGKFQAKYFVKQLVGYTVRATPESGNKVARAEPFAAQAEAGNVFIVKTGNPAQDAWIEPFLDELNIFPNGSFKDQVDAASRAFDGLYSKMFGNRKAIVVTGSRTVAG